MLIPIPGSLEAQSTVYDLKERLDWGEPALTIIDVRDRDAFNAGHISGAVPFPLGQLVKQACGSLELVRDIVVYGASDRETTAAAVLLKDAGYESVTELQGGLTAWKAAGLPIEGNSTAIA